MLENHPQREKDYCPVSILPALSKEFEQFVLKQLISYIDELSLLTPSISCFRKGHSTVTALLGIRDEILRAMKRVACVQASPKGNRRRLHAGNEEG